MHIHLHHGLGALALALAVTLCQAAEPVAQQVRQASTEADDGADVCADRPAYRYTAPDRLAGAAVVASDKLEQYRGGTGTVVNDTSLNGTVTGNSAVNVTTGGNFITGGSFANMSGIPIVVQNSGANVLIQNATVVNIDMN